MRVVKHREGGMVRRIVLLDDGGGEVVPVTRFLSHLTDSNYSPNTVCAYAYDLGHLARFLEAESPFVFLVGGTGLRRCEPLSYQAVGPSPGSWWINFDATA